jgi:hypothetical protein
MGKVFDEIDSALTAWIAEQRIFFVSTAPLAGDGLINCSPKAHDTFRILGPTTVAYLDLTGSGVETIAHLKENGRIVIMFCAFAGGPRIVRFQGTGEALEKGTPAYQSLIPEFDELPGTRGIIRVQLNRISDSCGYSVPLYDYQEDRDVLTKWATQTGQKGVLEYQQGHNLKSLDGLPGLTSS